MNENGNLKKQIAFLNDINRRIGKEMVQLQSKTGAVKKNILEDFDAS